MIRAGTAALLPAALLPFLLASCGTAEPVSQPVSRPVTQPVSQPVVQPATKTIGCGSQQLSVAVGTSFAIVGCTTGTTVTLDGAALQQGRGLAFSAVAVGGANITTEQRPVCGSGEVCPQHIVLVRIHVTVVAAPAG